MAERTYSYGTVRNPFILSYPGDWMVETAPSNRQQKLGRPTRPTDLPANPEQCIHVEMHTVDQKVQVARCLNIPTQVDGAHGWLCQNHLESEQTHHVRRKFADLDAETVAFVIGTDQRIIDRNVRFVAARCESSREQLTLLL